MKERPIHSLAKPWQPEVWVLLGVVVVLLAALIGLAQLYHQSLIERQLMERSERAAWASYHELRATAAAQGVPDLH